MGLSKEAAEVCGCPSLTNWFENSFQLLFVLALLTWLWQKKEEGRRRRRRRIIIIRRRRRRRQKKEEKNEKAAREAKECKETQTKKTIYTNSRSTASAAVTGNIIIIL